MFPWVAPQKKNIINQRSPRIVYLALGWQIIALKLELCLELIPFEFSQRTSSLDEDYPFFLEKRLLQ